MNIANKITLFRVFLVPIFLIVLYMDFSYNQVIATIIFIVAALTDTLDGYLARSMNLVTNFGKFVDPLADKILTSAALISLVGMNKVPAWVVVIIIAREFTITGFRVIAASEGVTIAASPLGKFKTITQLIAIPLLLLDNFPFQGTGIAVDTIMMYMALFFTVVSGIDYLLKNKGTLKLDDI